MLIIAITGGIGSGKSSLSRIFTRNGIPVIDADEIAHDVTRPGTAVYRRLRDELGAEYFHDANGGAIDRPRLRELITHHEEKRKLINAVTHPAILREILLRLVKSAVRLEKIVALDIPLLYETGMHRFLYPIIVITCDPEVQLQRVMRRDSCTEDEARARVQLQMPLKEKVARANYVINNNGSIEEMTQEAEKIIASIRSSWLPTIYRGVLMLVLVGVALSIVRLFSLV